LWMMNDGRVGPRRRRVEIGRGMRTESCPRAVTAPGGLEKGRLVSQRHHSVGHANVAVLSPCSPSLAFERSIPSLIFLGELRLKLRPPTRLRLCFGNLHTLPNCPSKPPHATLLPTMEEQSTKPAQSAPQQSAPSTNVESGPGPHSPTNEKKRTLDAAGLEDGGQDDRQSKRGKKDKNKYRQKTFQHGSKNYGRKNKDMGRGEYLYVCPSEP
jgi:hypothetical protein